MCQPELGFGIGFAVALIEFLIHFIKFISTFRVAKFIERSNPELKDYVTTTLTLQKSSKKYYSQNLVNTAIHHAIEKIKKVNPLFKIGARTSFLNTFSVFMGPGSKTNSNP